MSVPEGAAAESALSVWHVHLNAPDLPGIEVTSKPPRRTPDGSAYTFHDAAGLVMEVPADHVAYIQRATDPA